MATAPGKICVLNSYHTKYSSISILFWRNTRFAMCVRLVFHPESVVTRMKVQKRMRMNVQRRMNSAAAAGRVLSSLASAGVAAAALPAALPLLLSSWQTTTMRCRLCCRRWLIRMKMEMEGGGREAKKKTKERRTRTGSAAIGSCAAFDERQTRSARFWRRQFLIRFCRSGDGCAVVSVCVPPTHLQDSWLSAWLNVLLSRSHAPAALLSGLINLKRRAAELFSHDRTLSLRNFLRNSRKQPFTTRAQNKLKDTKIQILNCKNPIASHVAKRERERES